MNLDLFWPRLTATSTDSELKEEVKKDLSLINFSSVYDKNVVLDEVRRLYDQEQDRRNSADTKSGIYITAVVALIAVFISLLPHYNFNDGVVFSFVLYLSYSLALVQLFRTGLWSLSAIKVSGYNLLDWKDLINYSDSIEDRLVKELLRSLRINYYLNNKKLSSVKMSHATLISSTFWFVIFIIAQFCEQLFTSLSDVYLNEIHEPVIFICSWCNQIA